MKRKSGDINPLWRLLLIPAFMGYLYAFDFFKLIFKSSAPFEQNAWSYLMLAVCIAGFLCFMFASSNRKTVLAAGLILITIPVWLGIYAGIDVSGAKKIDTSKLDYIKIALYASCALWGLLPIRGKRAREWEKAPLAIALIMRVSAIALLNLADDFWIIDSIMFALSTLIGCAVDCAYRAPSIPDITVPAITCGWLALALNAVIDVKYALYASIALSLVAITALSRAKPIRKLYTGHMLTLAGMLANAVVILLSYKLL